MTPEQRKARARRRYQLSHGYTELDFPVPKDARPTLRTPLLPCIAVEHPFVASVMIPPARKPRNLNRSKFESKKPESQEVDMFTDEEKK